MSQRTNRSSSAVTNPANKTISYSYDDAGQRSEMLESAGSLFTYTYFADGRISNMRMAADGSYQWLYDDAARMQQIPVMQYGTTCGYDAADHVLCMSS